MLFSIIESIAAIFCVWCLLSVGCELRNYKGGHQYISSFRAKTAFQRLLTKWQLEKDINRKDIGKLTYLGYIGVLISAFFSVFVIPFSIYQFIIGNHETGAFAMRIWGGLSACWGILATLAQGIDSLINWLLSPFKMGK